MSIIVILYVQSIGAKSWNVKYKIYIVSTITKNVIIKLARVKLAVIKIWYICMNAKIIKMHKKIRYRNRKIYKGTVIIKE